jgi:predicted negative regulator of RcsB-dependent stress response
MPILEFIFQSFWHFSGTFILISILVQWKPFSSKQQGLTSEQFDKIIDQIKEKKKSK